MKLRLKFVIALLFISSASLVGAQTLQTIYAFTNLTITNAGDPAAPLTLGNDGNFYGTSLEMRYGKLFKVTTNGSLTTLVSFSGSNGASPNYALTVGNDGNFYGTTPFGDADRATIFQVTTNGTLTSWYPFTGEVWPSGLTLGNDGNLYGTATSFTVGSYNMIFRVTTNGTLTSLYDFTNGEAMPNGLTLGNDGNFYGTTETGGGIINSTFPQGMGTVFQMTTNGTLTTLASFNYTNGADPSSCLTLGNDGNFYGTTALGGITNSNYTYGMGTVFQVTTNGTVTTLASFNFANGVEPTEALTLGNDGNFYGTTYYGGITNYSYAHGMGTVFQVTTNGTLTALASFSSANGGFPNGLTLGNDGNFYGTTGESYSYPYGTVFRFLLTPVITIQPQSHTATAGATVTFTCATILQTVVFQWEKNGTNVINGGNISGATNSTLTITGISDSDAASYAVVVSDAEGSVLSSNATLTVIDPISITGQPTNLVLLAGTNANLVVSVTGTAPLFQWQLNSTNLLNATNAVYTIPTVLTNSAGNYAVVVRNQLGSVMSSNAALTVVFSPPSLSNYASSTATFTVTAISPESLHYQWQKNGMNLTNGGNILGATNSTLTLATLSDADAANYTAVVSDAYTGVTTAIASLTVNDSVFIAMQPLGQAVAVGSNATFTAIAYGAPPLLFQWYYNNSPIGSPTFGTTVSSYTLTNVQTNQSGNYSVQVINDLGSLTSSNATLTVVSPPVITAQPSNRTNNAATSATFSVLVSSVSPLNYQWLKNGTNVANGGRISGATNSTLTITSVSDNDAATYSVTVTNLAGNVTSSNATLTVIDPPGITTQPLGQRVLTGGSVSFTVSASGTSPLNYQWRFNSANILNATNAAYGIQVVATNNTGNYSVVVTNLAGGVTSSNALLTVLVAPSLGLQLSGGYPVVSLYGSLGNNFMVQYSPILPATNWLNLLSITNLSASPYQFLDPAGVDQPARFYRALFTQ